MLKHPHDHTLGLKLVPRHYRLRRPQQDPQHIILVESDLACIQPSPEVIVFNVSAKMGRAIGKAPLPLFKVRSHHPQDGFLCVLQDLCIGFRQQSLSFEERWREVLLLNFIDGPVALLDSQRFHSGPRNRTCHPPQRSSDNIIGIQSCHLWAYIDLVSIAKHHDLRAPIFAVQGCLRSLSAQFLPKIENTIYYPDDALLHRLRPEEQSHKSRCAHNTSREHEPLRLLDQALIEQKENLERAFLEVRAHLYRDFGLFAIQLTIGRLEQISGGQQSRCQLSDIHGSDSDGRTVVGQLKPDSAHCSEQSYHRPYPPSHTNLAHYQTPLPEAECITGGCKHAGAPPNRGHEEFAKTYWPKQDPIGKRFRLNDSQGPWIEVVGLTKTNKYWFIAEPPIQYLYLPFAQDQNSRMSLIVETEGDPAAIATPLREAVRGLDPKQPIYNVRTLSSFYEQRAISVVVMLTQMVATMGLLGLTLALISLL